MTHAWWEKIFPGIAQIKSDVASSASADLSAGAVVAIMLVPQAMGYALLAELPPIVGLYASTWPLIGYALFGSCRQLAVGPVALDSLLTGYAVSAVAAVGTSHYATAAAALAFWVGALQLLLAMVRAGKWIDRVPYSIVGGFTTAVALLIGLNQLRPILGLVAHNHERLWPLLRELFQAIRSPHWITAVIGTMSFILLMWLRKRLPKLPAPLVVVAAGAVVVALWHLDRRGVQIVGNVPRGLPWPALPQLSLSDLRLLWPDVLLITVIGLLEAFSSGRTMANRHGYALSPQRELVGLGIANMASALFRGLPVTGGLSRSAVNDVSGAKTQLAGVLTAIFVVSTLLLLTPLFYYLPKGVLGAIILAAVTRLFDIAGVQQLWKRSKPDVVVYMMTCIAVLFLGAQYGLVLGFFAMIICETCKRKLSH